MKTDMREQARSGTVLDDVTGWRCPEEASKNVKVWRAGYRKEDTCSEAGNRMVIETLTGQVDTATAFDAALTR
jgi:hypothetical protein